MIQDDFHGGKGCMDNLELQSANSNEQKPAISPQGMAWHFVPLSNTITWEVVIDPGLGRMGPMSLISGLPHPVGEVLAIVVVLVVAGYE